MKKKSIFLQIATASFFMLFSCTTDYNETVFERNLDKGWQLFSSEGLNATGSEISGADFDRSFGYPVTLPATVMHGLQQNGKFPDLFEFGVLEQMDTVPYQVPWWYRTTFNVNTEPGKDFFQITLNGINFKANVWLNGQKVAGDDLIQGSYGVWNFDVSELVVQGENHLAIEIIPPVFGVDVSKGFVDWNPKPADNLMGIWRDVTLKQSGPVSMRHSNVVTKVNKETLDEAEVTISTYLTNHSGVEQRAEITANFDILHLKKEVRLNPGETREIFFRPGQFPELHMKNPRLWWPNNMGEQALYDLELEVLVDNRLTDRDEFRFGIREIEDFWNENRYRGFKVNGQKLVVKSAGWVDDILLADSDQKVIDQLKYAQHVNLNSIRLESFWGRNRTIMETADELGLLLMLGWTAHWEWESYIGIPHDDYVSIRGEEAKTLHANNYRDQVLWHRRHPSVAIWTYGSDKLPRPSLEVMLNERMAKADTTRPILSYCGGAMLMGDSDPRQSIISGPTGVKMEGPYDWVAPVYWYIDERYGGAFGFNTEVGPGPQIPPLSSIRKMIPEEHLWPVDDVWLYYSGRNQFENLDRYLGAFHARYGEFNYLEDFLFVNQMASYEAIRPMFEAFSVNKYNSTGVVQWMFNSAWPTFYWQLFDYYLMPTGAFYGTRKAAAPLTLIYNYGNGNIYLNNDFLESQQNLNVAVKAFDLNSNLLFETGLTTNIDANSAKMVVEMPGLNIPSTTWFLDLRLKDDAGNEIANNFYWLSTVDDVPDFDRTTWYWTPNKQHADLTQIQNMPQANVIFSYDVKKYDDEFIFTVNLENQADVIAFFAEYQIVDKNTMEPVLPVFWDDNYISLLPGEKRVIKGSVGAKGINGDSLTVTLQGSNIIVQ
ncbi:glycoside hydrolase family 2 protein [Alkalitalea saponilacus]|uniref:Exo-1,4-beta-D-glucosaminidase n=1 Tax=Alkalitalea saponilacus TaxID=889453 RepID=A0A1T5HTG1_9BACT|nr:sugar-binding domain-containing protein [Alkalitalea saponilacus]ASB47662.1 glycoside hydrolase family 2 [Alkalitalea saponilacus]SKC23801.1 exo-1,4-beta-D-glucosaminidase [Alkalitalea saponilacus]